MFSDSRKAQRNSFAHHRADLLFAKLSIGQKLGKKAPASNRGETPELERAFKARVSAGILGFLPASAVA
jgi:hypothetical protein